jgi:hypothetical protein
VKSTDADKVIDALPGTKAPNLTGGVSEMLPNHHITKPVFIGGAWRRSVRRGVENSRSRSGRRLVEDCPPPKPDWRLENSELWKLRHRSQEMS